MMKAEYQRDVFITEIHSAARKNREILFLSADFGAPALDKFRQETPGQFFHCGISEQHMVDMAAGLALSGKQVYVYAMAPFVTLRCIEQIKCSLALMRLPVTILAVGVGLGYADAGPTHYVTEDLACMRSLVGVQVISPADAESAREIARLTLENPELRVVRLERHALPGVYRSGEFDSKSGFQELVKGKKVCVVSSGHLLHRVLKCRQESTTNEFGVIDLFQIKPINDGFRKVLDSYEKIITVEEQCLSGGFGSAVLEFVSDAGLAMPVRRLGLREKYVFENGGRERLLDEGGVSISAIEKAVKSLW